jgi:hypothetical protein
LQDLSSSMSSLVLIKFDKYTKLDFPECPQRIVSVFPVIRQFEFKRVQCSQTQFPLYLVYTITVYKSQELTLSKAVLNLNQRKHCLDLSYIAVLQVKTLNSILFKRPFDFEYFIDTNSTISQN